MLRKIKNVILLAVCAISIVLPSISAAAEEIEPRAQYAYCGSCDSLGLRETRVTEPPTHEYSGSLTCRTCSQWVSVYYYVRTHHYECVNCHATDEEPEHVYYASCGHTNY